MLKSVKEKAIADHLAENSIDGYQPVTDLFPDEFIFNIEAEEEYPNWCTYFDGAVCLWELNWSYLIPSRRTLAGGHKVKVPLH